MYIEQRIEKLENIVKELLSSKPATQTIEEPGKEQLYQETKDKIKALMSKGDITRDNVMKLISSISCVKGKLLKNLTYEELKTVKEEIDII